MNRLFHRLYLRRTGVRRLLPWLTGVLCAALLLSGLPGVNVVNAQAGQSVYALPGTLRVVEDKTYDTALATFDGQVYGLFGMTPEVELEIIRLRALGPAEVVKVWGTLYPNGLTSQDPEIVVESILSESGVVSPTATVTAPPVSPTPVPATPTPGTAQATVATGALNVRSGPGTDYRIVNTLDLGATCPIVGRNANSTWWNIRCANGLNGWVSASLVTVSGSTADVPVVTVAPPPPTPTPTATTVPVPPVSGSAWSASFYGNRDLAGDPIAVTQYENIDFNWGGGAPVGNVPADNFSARFERVLRFPTANYVIEFRVDDGVRLILDGTIVLENWQVGSARTLTVQRLLSGDHTFRIEYFEAQGDALLQMNVRQVSADPVWQVQYFDNMQLAGDPILVRGEPRHTDFPLNHNWGTGSPAAGTVPANRWSARFEGTFYFEGGDYNFSANSDDGIRLYLDGIRVLDAWEVSYKNTSNVFRQLGAGNHRITVEYYEFAENANLRVWWDRLNPPIDGGGDDDGRGRDE